MTIDSAGIMKVMYMCISECCLEFHNGLVAESVGKIEYEREKHWLCNKIGENVK